MSQQSEEPKTGLLLIGHGTRDAVGVAEFLDVARQVAALRPDVVTEACFLEIAEPTIAAGVAALVRRGAHSHHRRAGAAVRRGACQARHSRSGTGGAAKPLSLWERAG